MKPREACRRELRNGPAIRLVEGLADGIQGWSGEVDSLFRAADSLRAEGWLGEEREHGLSIAREPLQGLEVRLMGRV